MRRHTNRSAYYVLGEGLVREPTGLIESSGCPFAGANGEESADVPLFRFGRMFGKSSLDQNSKEFQDLMTALIDLGRCMNDPQKYGHKPLPSPPADSNIPAGYTYLGQFIAHEITYDGLQQLPEVEINPQNLRSPCIDLDSLYGGGPADDSSEQLYYELDPVFLKLGSTQSFNGFAPQNDLFRKDSGKDRGEAVIADPRNDENLAVAQTQVALIKFHNKVVSTLRSEGHHAGDLFDCARMQVARHFQWIILNDFLPTIVNEHVLASVKADGPVWFTPSADSVYMPLEFSAAAFRLGHSMVRREYRWNQFHAGTEPGSISPATLVDLFDQTAFSGGIGKTNATRALPGDWIIDWRRFFKFDNHPIDPARANMAAKIDTNFDLHLAKNFPAPGIPEERKPLMVRNLLRGLALGLPTGQEVAKKMCAKKTLTQQEILTDAEILDGPAQDILNNKLFIGKTPLWYYILREAELKGKGNKLGPVGSRIVAETLFGLIKRSPNSILSSPNWRPRFTTRNHSNGTPIFEMTDLLEFAGVVNPYAT